MIKGSLVSIHRVGFSHTVAGTGLLRSDTVFHFLFEESFALLSCHLLVLNWDLSPQPQVARHIHRHHHHSEDHTAIDDQVPLNGDMAVDGARVSHQGMHRHDRVGIIPIGVQAVNRQCKSVGFNDEVTKEVETGKFALCWLAIIE